MSLIEQVLGPGGALERVRGEDVYEHRPEQIRMAAAVAEVLECGGTLLVEGGTGTGKSLAYLVAAVAAERQVVISTGTKNLQDQLLGDDIPQLERALGRDISAVGLKGLSNYLCLRKLSAALASERAESVRSSLERVRRWAERSETGDRAELVEIPEDSPLWSELCADAETRQGPKCPFNEGCFVTRARRAAQEAQVVVVNHHLFFSDLVMRVGLGRLLPDYEAVVFDEAHQIDAVATAFFGYRVSSRQLTDLVGDARRALRAAGELSDEVSGLLDRLERAVEGFTAALSTLGAADRGGRSELRSEELSGGAEESYFRLDSALEALSAHLAPSRASLDEAVMACGRRASTIRDDLGEILGPSRPASVHWIEHGPRSVVVGASPVDVSGVLSELVFGEVGAVVLTSATLTVEGRFDFVRERLGLEAGADELILPSPFDFERQAALYLPREAPDPRRPGALEEVVDLLSRTVEIVGGGALALFTSHRDMQRAAALLRAEVGFTVHMQGERPRRALLEALRRARRPTALLGTASFWEGVDVPGEALRLVAIARLPFTSPADPVVAARLKRLEEEGRSPFLDYQVPQASLTLKQGFGRLIRTRRDRGVVAVFDRRIVSMPYGSTFLSTLPRCRVIDDEGALERWWSDGERDQ